MQPIDPKKKAVMTFPYEGGLYYLFSRENPMGQPPERGHPYYESLYGDNPRESKNNAVNLMTLFEEVLLPPADEYLPDYRQCSTEQGYYNPDLRVRVGRDWDFLIEARQIAASLIRDGQLLNLLNNFPELPQDPAKLQFLLERIIGQLKLAIQNNAVIIGGQSAGHLVSEVWRLAEHEITEVGSKTSCPDVLSFGKESFKVTALAWECDDVNSLRAIRSSMEIREYADSFRDALFSAANSDEMNREMRRLMREAMDSEAIAKRVKGALETVGVTSTGVGLIPGLGTPASLVGLASFLGYKKAEREEQKHQWYLLGTKIREVSLKQILQEA